MISLCTCSSIYKNKQQWIFKKIINMNNPREIDTITKNYKHILRIHMLQKRSKESDLLTSLNILDSKKLTSPDIFHQLGYSKVPRTYIFQNLIPVHLLCLINSITCLKQSIKHVYNLSTTSPIELLYFFPN